MKRKILPPRCWNRFECYRIWKPRRGKLLQIVLVGQPELRQQLARPELRQLNQRIALRYHIQPFNRQETEDYITHRLVVAGSHGGVKFSRRALSTIYRLSEGIPRKINLLCDRAMLSAYVHETNLIDHTHVRQAWSELEGPEGGVPHPSARGLSRHRFLILQGLLLGLVLTVGGGTWLGMKWSTIIESQSSCREKWPKLLRKPWWPR